MKMRLNTSPVRRSWPFCTLGVDDGTDTRDCNGKHHKSAIDQVLFTWVHIRCAESNRLLQDLFMPALDPIESYSTRAPVAFE